MFPVESVRRVSDPYLHPLPPRERDAYAEEQEETSCRGFGGVPQINQSPPKNGGSRGLKEGCETASGGIPPTQRLPPRLGVTGCKASVGTLATRGRLRRGGVDELSSLTADGSNISMIHSITMYASQETLL